MMTKTSEEQTTTTFKLPVKDLERFDAVAAAKRTSRAALMRACILDTISQYDEQAKEAKA